LFFYPFSVKVMQLKCTKTVWPLVARLRSDPLGELKRSPRPPSRNMGPTSKGRGREREGREREGGEREGRGKEEGKGRIGKSEPPLFVQIYAHERSSGEERHRKPKFCKMKANLTRKTLNLF